MCTVLLSVDEGETWKSVNAGLSLHVISWNHNHLTANGNYLFVGTGDSSVWRHTLIFIPLGLFNLDNCFSHLISTQHIPDKGDTRSDIMAGTQTKIGACAKTLKLAQHQHRVWQTRIGKNWSRNRRIPKNAE